MRFVRSFSSLVARGIPVAALAALAALAVTAAPRAAQAQAFNFNFATGFQGFTSTVPTGNAAAAWQYQPTAGVGGTGAWFTNGATTVTQTFLTSPNLVLTQSGTITGSFTHRFNFENSTSAPTTGFDGGIVEYSTNAGATWTQVGTSLVTGQGYTGTISSSFMSPIAGRPAFTGVSPGYATPVYVTSNFTLGTTAAQSFTAGNNLLFRFNAGYDQSLSVANPNWVVGRLDLNVVPSAAPEPGSLGLLGMGLVSGAGTMGIVRRRRKAA